MKQKESMADRLNRCVASFGEEADESSAMALTITPMGEGCLHTWGEEEKLARVLKESMLRNDGVARIVLQATEQYIKYSNIN